MKTIGGASVCACTGLTGAHGCAMIRGVSGTAAIRQEAYIVDHGKLIVALDRCPCLAASGGAGKLSIDTGDAKARKIIVLHVQEDHYLAFADRCTHGGRELNYLPEQEKLQCSSFGHSTFDLQDQVVKGPAKGPDMNQSAPNTRLWQAGTLEQVRMHPAAYGPALERLRQEAEQALAFAPVSVMDKKVVPPSGDRHDYLSMGPYWWPNPDTADGLPYIRRDGERNPEGEALDRGPLGAMCSRTETLALAGYLLDDDRYVAHAAVLLRTWFLEAATRMNPHLEYGQAIPGICHGRGIGIIDTAGSFSRLVDALRLLEDRPAWTAADTAGMQEWMRAYLIWLLESDHGKDEARQANNHGTYYDVQATALALYTGQPEIAMAILQAVPEKRIASQIEPDGAQPLELRRTNSRGYSQMNALGFVNLAMLGAPLGVDLWRFETPDGRGLRRAIDWFIPYIKSEKDWTWQQISPFQTGRYALLFHHAATHYGEARYREMVEATACEEFATERLQLTFPGVNAV